MHAQCMYVKWQNWSSLPFWITEPKQSKTEIRKEEKAGEKIREKRNKENEEAEGGKNGENEGKKRKKLGDREREIS